MFVLGMGSQFGGIEALCLAITEKWPHLSNHHWRVTAGMYDCQITSFIPEEVKNSPIFLKNDHCVCYDKN